TNPSRLYRSVKASANTRLSWSTSRRVGRSGPRTLRSGRHILASNRLIPDCCDSGREVKAHPDDAIEALANRIDMRDQNDLGESVCQAAQQIYHRGSAILIQRAEDLVQNEERERLSRPLGDHLTDRQPKRQVGHILLTAGD